MESPPKACRAGPCLGYHVLSLRQPHRTGWPLGSAQPQASPGGNKAVGKCLLAPSPPHREQPLLRSLVCSRLARRRAGVCQQRGQWLPPAPAQTGGPQPGAARLGRSQGGPGVGPPHLPLPGPTAASSAERPWNLDSSGDRGLASGWRGDR